MTHSKFIKNLILISFTVINASTSRYIINMMMKEKSPTEMEENLAANLLSFTTKKLDNEYSKFSSEFTDTQVASLEQQNASDFLYILNEVFFRMFFDKLNEMCNCDIKTKFYIPPEDPELKILNLKFLADMGSENHISLLQYYHSYSINHPDFYVEHMKLVIARFIFLIQKNSNLYDCFSKILTFDATLQDVFENKACIEHLKKLLKQDNQILKFMRFNDIMLELNIERFLKAMFSLTSNDANNNIIIGLLINNKFIINEIFLKILNISQKQQITDNLFLEKIRLIRSYLKSKYNRESEKLAVNNFKQQLKEKGKKVTFEINKNNYEQCKSCLENILRYNYPGLQKVDDIIFEVKELCVLIFNHFQKMINELNTGI